MILLHCARVPAALPPGTLAAWLGALPRSRRAVLKRRLTAGSGLESLTGLALLAGFSRARRLPSLARIRWTGRGKPRIPGGPEFSIAHSGGIAVCAVAPKGIAIGVDIEPVGRARVAALRIVANEIERGELERGSISATELWTCKEAVLKAAGAGLSEIGRVLIEGERGSLDGARYHLRCLCIAGGLVLAIATSRRVATPRIHWPSPSRLFASPPAGRRPGFP